MRKFIIPLLAAGTMFAAAPASAQYGVHYQGGGHQIGQQINQLHNQIVRAQQNRRISPREASGLKRQATTVQRNFRLFSRDGLNRRELAVLQQQVQQIRYNLRSERRDADRRRG